MKTKHYSKPNQVVVVWLDAFSTPVWLDPGEFEADGERCATLGYLIGENKKALWVAQTFSASGGAADVITIPRGCVEKITRIKRVKKTTK